jgi:hypothetical protein
MEEVILTLTKTEHITMLAILKIGIIAYEDGVIDRRTAAILDRVPKDVMDALSVKLEKSTL